MRKRMMLLVGLTLLAGCSTGYYAKLENASGEVRNCDVDVGHARYSWGIHQRCVGNAMAEGFEIKERGRL